MDVTSPVLPPAPSPPWRWAAGAALLATGSVALLSVRPDPPTASFAATVRPSPLLTSRSLAAPRLRPLQAEDSPRDSNLIEIGAKLMFDLGTFGTKDIATPKYPELTYKIGEEVYLDVSGWHVYAKDVRLQGDLRLNSVLARELGDLLVSGRYTDAAVDGLLDRLPVPLGGGPHRVPLAALVPKRCVMDLKDLCRRFDD